MRRDATEAEADQAAARLMPIIEAANASNQAGENAVVAVLHAYDCHHGLVKALLDLVTAVKHAASPEFREEFSPEIAAANAALAKTGGAE